MHLNAAMFEQNGRSGYVLKPRPLRDRSHPLFDRFNPFDKDCCAYLKPHTLAVEVISGQYVSQQTTYGNPLVEVELFGIPVDCAKVKGKVVTRNTVNPVWRDSFTFKVRSTFTCTSCALWLPIVLC